MTIARSCFLALLALLGIGPWSSPANATWLGLADGTYDVTLTCVLSTVIPCPSTIDGTMTIAGSTATAFDFTVNGQAFIGTPGNATVTTSLGTDQLAVLELTPFAFLSLQYFLTGGFPGLTQQSWGYCNNFTPTSCTPDTQGNWTVPEPPGVTVLAFGLGLMGLAGLARRRGV